MELPSEILSHLKAQRFDAVEDHWLTRLEQDADHHYFIAMARAIVDAGAAERARPLLEMLDEKLAEVGAWQERFEVLRHFGELLHKAPALHKTVLETLRQLYGHLPSFEQMVEKLGLRRAPEDVPKTWRKAERLAALMVYDVGTLVHLEGQGIGRVVEVNMVLESFKIEFHGAPELRVGFHAAPKMLDVPSPEHVLRRKLEDPAGLERLRDHDPPELLRLVLQSYQQPRSAAEIKRDLTGIVPESKWNTWWTAARKHRQVLVASKGRQAYSWAASTGHAHESVWQSFENVEPRAKIDLLRRNGERDPELRRRMSEVLVAVAGERFEKEPGLACEIFFSLEKSGELPTESVPWRPAKLLAAPADLKPLLRGVQDRAVRERLYTMVRGSRQDWAEVFAQALVDENDPKLLDQLTDNLIATSSPQFDSFFDQVLSQPRKAPAGFTWLAERAADRPTWLDRNPMRLLKQILSSLGHSEFAPFKTRLLALFESGSTVPRLFSVLSEDQAPQALEAIERSPEIEDYRRDPLRNSLLLKFPHLRQQEEAPLYATPEAIVAKRAELKQTVEVELPANRRAIEEARALGDLRENFEYKSARQRHEYLSSRAAALNRDLGRVRPIEVPAAGIGEVVIGCRVALRSAGGSEWKITILGPWESKPEDDVLSNESEIAKSLLGRKPGEQAMLAGESWTVVGVEPYR